MDEMMIRMKQDIRDLKTYHAKRSLAKMSYYEFSASFPVPYRMTAIRVTYAEGTQPIITQLLGGDVQRLFPLSPNGNTQDFVYTNLIGDDDYANEQKIYFFSTREITNIQQVSL